jgi:hypothetical protein
MDEKNPEKETCRKVLLKEIYREIPQRMYEGRRT